eukprot:jgi/Botrbrau1/15761/Bobra.4_1s0125.1
MAETQFRLVKLGGAAITEKSIKETLNSEVLVESCRSLSAIVNVVGSARTVIVHGAGSFGHQTAHAAGLVKGDIKLPIVRSGIVETRLSVCTLNNLVVGQLRNSGILACGLSPFGSWRTCNRKVTVHNAAFVRELCLAGFVPVLHGDVVLDDDYGCTILSGDSIMATLAAELAPTYVVFLTNVDGVYNIPPDQPGAQLLRHIQILQDGGWTAEGLSGAAVLSSQDHDVTGGMAGKVAEAGAIAQLGIPVIIARAGSESGALACQHGSKVLQMFPDTWRGTVIDQVQNA